MACSNAPLHGAWLFWLPLEEDEAAAPAPAAPAVLLMGAPLVPGSEPGPGGGGVGVGGVDVVKARL